MADEKENESAVTYTAKELFNRVDQKLDTVLSQMDTKASAAALNEVQQTQIVHAEKISLLLQERTTQLGINQQFRDYMTSNQAVSSDRWKIWGSVILAVAAIAISFIR